MNFESESLSELSYFALAENKAFSLAKITEFNDSCFPARACHQAYDHYRFLHNPFAPQNLDFIYCVTENSQYVAQMLSMPVPLSLNGQIIPAFWGQDYFVKDYYRGRGIGKKLSDYYLSKDFYIAVGFTPRSAAIHQKNGARKVGYLYSYQKWATPLSPLKFLMHRSLRLKPKDITAYHFPEKANSFTLVDDANSLHLPLQNWNKNTIESLRNLAYFRWRFFYKPNRYFIYQLIENKEKNAVYFVAKPYFYKGVNWLKVVDYRFENADAKALTSIIHAAEKIRSGLNLFGVLISSSLKISNGILEKNRYKQVRAEVVLTTYPFLHEETDSAHNHLIMSFADSDLDMHTNLGKFNYGEDY